MSAQFPCQLKFLEQPGSGELLADIRRGIEKESLRIDGSGKLAQSPHPQGLGSALTHGSITTDYSEALMEFITGVSPSIDQSLEALADVHSYVYQHLNRDEILWGASMPCIMEGDENIPVAQYGSSNVARMKTVYRYGLGHRYGRRMQTIAGIHYNFSMPEAYWQHSWEEAGKPGALADYITERYLGLIRNFRRYSWLLIYLYGASPAVCASFLRGIDGHNLQPFEDSGKSLHLPYGTALRMGDLGYNSAAQKGLSICYNSLDNYIHTLGQAIRQPHPEYRSIPCGEDDNYQQLNTSLLQIENEFYSPIRPKRVANSGEAPLCALRRAGIEYVEVRCVDVSPFSPLGLDAGQIRVMDAFLLFCLTLESPPCDDREQAIQAANMEAVVNRGREPGLVLQTCSGSQPLSELANELLNGMQPLAELLDGAHGGSAYSDELQVMRERVDDPELTPSARILREMQEQNLPFFRLGLAYSERWAEHFRQRELNPAVQQAQEEEAERSLAAQRAVEDADQVSFSDYLQTFYAQYDSLA